MKTIITLMVAILVTTFAYAQRTTDIENGKDYPLISRFDRSIIEYYKSTKWDSYKIPINFITGELDWTSLAKLEGEIIQIQYSVSPDNNPTYVAKKIAAITNQRWTEHSML